MAKKFEGTQILEATETTGSVFDTYGGLYEVHLEAHSGGVWTVEQRARVAGAWIETDLTFDDDGVKAIFTTTAWEYRITGGTVGAIAYMAAAILVGQPPS